jgi:hypothetical protein
MCLGSHFMTGVAIWGWVRVVCLETEGMFVWGGDDACGFYMCYEDSFTQYLRFSDVISVSKH